MTPRVEEGQYRFVLSWPDAPKDLDIHTFFKISRFSQCEIYFGERECIGTSLETDNLLGGKKGVESVYIHEIGNYIYTFAVQYNFDKVNTTSIDGTEITTTENAPNPTLFWNSKAKISIYTSELKVPYLQVFVPSFEENNILDPGSDELSYTWWLAFCLDGSKGLSSLIQVNKLTTEKPTADYCQNLYTE